MEPPTMCNHLPRVLAMLLVCLPTLGAQTMPFALASAPGADTHRLWIFDEATGQVEVLTGPLSVLDPDLAGAARSDAHRLDRPALVTDEEFTRVRLPGGGSLYLAEGEEQVVLVHVRANGSLVTPLELPVEGVVESLAVSAGGDHALVATKASHGGDLWWIELASDTATLLSAGDGPHSVDPHSLRIGAGHAWFVAGGVVHVRDLHDPAATGFSSIALQGPAQAEVALAPFEDRLAVVVGADAQARELVVVDGAGMALIVTDAPAAVDLPGYDHPLGPFVVFSPDGAVIAWRTVEAGSAELHARHVDVPAPSLHLTQEPAFPAYIDNVGILGFTVDRILQFVTGDQTLGGTVGLDLVSAGEVFAADLSDPAAPVFSNVSQTGGTYEPPFTDVATLRFDQGWFDPLRQHLVLAGPQPDGTHALTTVPVYPLGSGGTIEQLSGSEDPVTLWSLAERLLVATQPPEAPELPAGAPEEDGNGAPEIDLSLDVLEFGETGSLQLSSLLAIPDGLEVERLATDADGLRIGFVAVVDDLGELPAVLDPASGSVLFPTWPVLLDVGPVVAFSSSGDFYFGLGGEAGPMIHGRWTPGSGTTKLPLPKLPGFPLPH